MLFWGFLLLIRWKETVVEIFGNALMPDGGFFLLKALDFYGYR